MYMYTVHCMYVMKLELNPKQTQTNAEQTLKSW